MPEEQVVEQARRGDRMAFRSLVLAHSHDMFRLAWRLTQDGAAAEDVVQEAFIKAHRKLPEFRGNAGFRTWIHRITVNTAMDHLRREKTRARYEEQAAEAIPAHRDDRMDRRHDLARQTQAALAGLTDLERAALVLRHFEGRAIAEIAGDLGLSPNACKQAIFRAVRKMRAALEPVANP